MPTTVIYANLLPFLAMLTLLISVRINPLFDKQQNKLFFRSALLMCLMLIVISVDYTCSLWEQEFEAAWLVRRITSFLNFSAACVVPIALVRIFINRKLNRLLYIPALLNLVLCAVSVFTGLIFFLPQEGGYERGTLFFIPFLTVLFYMVYLLFLTYKKRQDRTLEAFYLAIAMGALVFAFYLEVVEYYKFLSWDFAAILLILYYLLLNVNRSKLDPLTGAYNRAMYVQKIDTHNASRPCLLMMIDINNFKAINDTKGHDEGDRVLIYFVHTLHSYMNRKNTLYRIGGDEFVVLSEEATVQALEQHMAPCFAELKKNNICCAVGIEPYDAARGMEAAAREADMKMYADKRRYYAEKCNK